MPDILYYTRHLILRRGDLDDLSIGLWSHVHVQEFQRDLSEMPSTWVRKRALSWTLPM